IVFSEGTGEEIIPCYPLCRTGITLLWYFINLSMIEEGDYFEWKIRALEHRLKLGLVQFDMGFLLYFTHKSFERGLSRINLSSWQSPLINRSSTSYAEDFVTFEGTNTNSLSRLHIFCVLTCHFK